MHMTRTFTDAEQANRDAWSRSRIENDCTGCETIYHADGYNTCRPAQHCPVHGVECLDWWDELNVDLDLRWPGTRSDV